MGGAQQADIDAAGQQAFHLFGGNHLFQRNIDIGSMRGALQQQAGQEAVAAGGGEAEGDGAGFAAGDAAGGQRRAFGQAQDAPRLQQKKRGLPGSA